MDEICGVSGGIVSSDATASHADRSSDVIRLRVG